MSEDKNIINEDMDGSIDKVLEARRRNQEQSVQGRNAPQGAAQNRVRQSASATPQPGMYADPRRAQPNAASGMRIRNDAQPVQRPQGSVASGTRIRSDIQAQRAKPGAPSQGTLQNRAQGAQPIQPAQYRERSQNLSTPSAQISKMQNTSYASQPARPSERSVPARGMGSQVKPSETIGASRADVSQNIRRTQAESDNDLKTDLQSATPGKRITSRVDDEDGDIKIAGVNNRRSADMEATRKTGITPKPKKKVSDEKTMDNDIGGTLVVSMIRAIVYIVVICVVSAILSVFLINIGNDVFAFVKDDEIIEITIPENAKRKDIAEILYENGVIKYKDVFEFYGSFKHIEEDFVAGDYSVTPMMNYKSLYYEFKPKPVSGTSWITVPEGFTTDEIIDLMISYGIGGTKDDYVKAINEDEYDYWFVKELDDADVMSSGERFYRLDGYLFPDTYEFYNASSAHTIIDKFLQRFDEVYTEVFKERAAEFGLTTDQAVILASIIEKEAGHSSDFRNVSSVFHNRLSNQGTFPRFESDATVVYAIQHITGERPSDVNHETISYDSPYNTYLYNSFPPGAIANPGLNALKYAVYPADTSYYYFVSSGSGLTLFASSKWEHDKNVAYIKNN